MRKKESNSPADIKVSEEGVGEDALLQPVEKTMVNQVVTCSPCRTTEEQESTLQPVEDPVPEQVDVS